MPLDWKVIPKADLTPGAAEPDAVAAYTYGTVMTYNTKAISKPPHSWAEWWNTSTYSCRRTMRNVPVDDLEMAVMSSGVAPGRVYPIDLALAYKQLDAIQPQVVSFWDSGAQSIQLVAEGSACLGIAWNNRVVAAMKDGQPIGFVWDEALIHHDYYTVMKDAPHSAAAMKLIAYAMRADVQAKIANAIALVPVNMQAFSAIDTAIAKNMPTAENLAHAVSVPGWYGDTCWEEPSVTQIVRDIGSPDVSWRSIRASAWQQVARRTLAPSIGWLIAPAIAYLLVVYVLPIAITLHAPFRGGAGQGMSALWDAMTDSGYPVVARFRTTVGLPGRLSPRLQPNHPTDDPAGIAASVLDGLLLGSGDATIGINPASDSPQRTHSLLCLLDEIRQRLDIPTQSCVLAHVTTTLDLIKRGSPVDLVFQSIGGTVYRLSCPQGLRRSLVRQWQDAPAKTRPAPP